MASPQSPRHNAIFRALERIQRTAYDFTQRALGFTLGRTQRGRQQDTPTVDIRSNRSNQHPARSLRPGPDQPASSQNHTPADNSRASVDSKIQSAPIAAPLMADHEVIGQPKSVDHFVSVINSSVGTRQTHELPGELNQIVEFDTSLSSHASLASPKSQLGMYGAMLATEGETSWREEKDGDKEVVREKSLQDWKWPREELDFGVMNRDLRSEEEISLQLAHSNALEEDLDITAFVENESEMAEDGSTFFDLWRGSYRLAGNQITVALKTFRRPETLHDLAIRQALVRDISRWKTLSHANILPTLGVVHIPRVDEALLAYVCPWMENRDVMAYLESHPATNRILLLQGIAEGLKFLHGQSPEIVHGDIRGSNVLIDSQGRAALCDFGLFRYVKDTVDSNLGHLDWIRWRAPETLPNTEQSSEEEEETMAADIFSLAMCFYEIMTGRRPFLGAGIIQVYHALLSRRRPAIPAEWLENPSLSKLSAVVVECWNQDPFARPDAVQVVEQIRALI